MPKTKPFHVHLLARKLLRTREMIENPKDSWNDVIFQGRGLQNVMKSRELRSIANSLYHANRNSLFDTKYFEHRQECNSTVRSFCDEFASRFIHCSKEEGTHIFNVSNMFSSFHGLGYFTSPFAFVPSALDSNLGVQYVTHKRDIASFCNFIHETWSNTNPELVSPASVKDWDIVGPLLFMLESTGAIFKHTSLAPSEVRSNFILSLESMRKAPEVSNFSLILLHRSIILSLSNYLKHTQNTEVQIENALIKRLLEIESIISSKVHQLSPHELADVLETLLLRDVLLSFCLEEKSRGPVSGSLYSSIINRCSDLSNQFMITRSAMARICGAFSNLDVKNKALGESLGRCLVQMDHEIVGWELAAAVRSMVALGGANKIVAKSFSMRFAQISPYLKVDDMGGLGYFLQKSGVDEGILNDWKLDENSLKINHENSKKCHVDWMLREFEQSHSNSFISDFSLINQSNNSKNTHRRITKVFDDAEYER